MVNSSPALWPLIPSSARDHTTLTHCQYEVSRFAAFELFAVYRTGEVDGDADLQRQQRLLLSS